MLQVHDHIYVRIAVHEVVISGVLDKSGAKKHDEVKLAFEGAPQLVQKVLCFTGICGSHD